jgi:hypothetical protein
MNRPNPRKFQPAASFNRRVSPLSQPISWMFQPIIHVFQATSWMKKQKNIETQVASWQFRLHTRILTVFFVEFERH